MKKIFLWLSLSIALPSGLWAQPGFYFNNVAACEGDTFCVDVTVDNFSNIVSTSYQVLFDPEVIQFVNMQMPSLPGFSDSNIDASAAASGPNRDARVFMCGSSQFNPVTWGESARCVAGAARARDARLRPDLGMSGDMGSDLRPPQA